MHLLKLTHHLRVTQVSSSKRGVLRTAGSVINSAATLASDTVRVGLFGIGAVAAVAKIGWDEAKRGYTKTDELLSSAEKTQDQAPEQQELDLTEQYEKFTGRSS